MSRYQKMFDRLKKNGEGAFIPFVVLFDPDRERSKQIILALIEAGADALELGLAFSDPLADGPTIQKADLRALKSGSNIREAFKLVGEIREQHSDIPMGILTYANLVFKNSPEWFYSHAKQCGIDSVLVADLPILEAEEYSEIAIKHGIDPILIAPPNLPKNRMADLARLGRGFTYVVTRSGVTGAREKVSFDHKGLLKNLASYKAPPPLFGFGISEPEHVKSALKEGALGAICGSKIVSVIENNLADQKKLINEISALVRAMKQATKL